MESRPPGALQDLLARLVPGTDLREGIERILAARMGALIVVGDDARVLSVCTGGFHIDAELSAPRLAELAKMDGALVLNAAATRIAWANVHLVPDPRMATTETGTRHRTAERVARSIGVSVITVSEEMGSVTLYRGTDRHELTPTEAVANRVNHLLQALRRLRTSFDDATDEAASEEHAELVAHLLQRAELARRVAVEVDELVVQLGEEGRLARSELTDLTAGLAADPSLVARFCAPEDQAALADGLAGLSLEELARLDEVQSLLLTASAPEEAASTG